MHAFLLYLIYLQSAVANKFCEKLPKNMEQDINSLIVSLAAIENKQYILEKN
jgi:hypothetical protein